VRGEENWADEVKPGKEKRGYLEENFIQILLKKKKTLKR